ncbi:alpha/beta hydrolase family protein [Nonomuraea sp. NPDC048826]|uniref:alpha/beta hydrolase family protein n=1 Tax=Nonomuraea sp. NPDC048826 TaxID=3364347 RepID=UPI0037191218
MRRPSLVLSALALTTALLVPGSAEARTDPPADLASRTSGAAHPRPGVPDDQPLPGYTVENPPLPPAIVHGRPARVLQGVHGHAAYQIEVPPRWNGSLVMWAHGFRGATRVLTVDPPGYGLRQRLLDQGYAWAASSYYANDYDVRAGVLSTRALAGHFARLVGKPKRTFISGASMGGHITVRSLEQYPGFYDAALPMCGVLGDHELFDFFLDFHLVAQDLADVPAYPFPADYATSAVPEIQARLGLTGQDPGNALGAQLRDIVINQGGGERPGAEAAFAYWKDFLFGLAGPEQGGTLAQEPGRVGTNLGTRYAPASPVNVNATVQRVPPADPVARLTRALTAVPSVSGRINVPVLSLHDLGDNFVPFSMEQYYWKDVARHGRSSYLVQRAIRAVGHCEFSPAEAGAAWDDLVRWQRGGPRPAGDDVITPSVVADPHYGCRFTDPSAYGTGTRALFPACP